MNSNDLIHIWRNLFVFSIAVVFTFIIMKIAYYSFDLYIILVVTFIYNY